jgi:hypothetical protein
MPIIEHRNCYAQSIMTGGEEICTDNAFRKLIADEGLSESKGML